MIQLSSQLYRVQKKRGRGSARLRYIMLGAPLFLVGNSFQDL